MRLSPRPNGDTPGVEAVLNPSRDLPQGQPIPYPQLRQVSVEALTSLGWVQGILHLPMHQTLLEFVRLADDLIKVTRVRLPGEPQLLPFVAIRPEAITLIVPTLEQALVEPPGHLGMTAPRPVMCLLPQGQLRGTLDVITGMRLSDQLRQYGEFMVLRHCLLAPYGETLNSPQARSFATVVVSLRQSAGVAEDR
jgi:hypothetical protein